MEREVPTNPHAARLLVGCGESKVSVRAVEHRCARHHETYRGTTHGGIARVRGQLRGRISIQSHIGDKDDTQRSKKLDEMDLNDSNLNCVEEHEVVVAQNEGASLSGEGFLEQFVNISDVKNHMNLENIIPAEERQQFERECKAEEIAAAETKDRKQSHPQISYEGMDAEHTPSTAPAKKPRHPAPQRNTPSQKAMELNERDVRVLVRSLQKWGDIRQRYDTIVRGACINCLRSIC